MMNSIYFFVCSSNEFIGQNWNNLSFLELFFQGSDRFTNLGGIKRKPCNFLIHYHFLPCEHRQRSVLALEDSAIDADQVENLIKFCPTKEEMDLIKVKLIMGLRVILSAHSF